MANLIKDLKLGYVFTHANGGALYMKMDGHHVCVYTGAVYRDAGTDKYAHFLGTIDLNKLDKAIERKFNDEM